MRIIVILSFLVLFQLSVPVSGYGQSGNSFDQFKDDISDKLPPLSVLIDSSILHNANVQYKDQQLIINECKLKSKKMNGHGILACRQMLGMAICGIILRAVQVVLIRFLLLLLKASLNTMQLYI